MIFVASGTQDGRGLVKCLLDENYKIMASVVTDYGKNLLPQHENLIINDHKLDEKAMQKCLEENYIILRIIWVLLKDIHFLMIIIFKRWMS